MFLSVLNSIQTLKTLLLMSLIKKQRKFIRLYYYAIHGFYILKNAKSKRLKCQL